MWNQELRQEMAQLLLVQALMLGQVPALVLVSGSALGLGLVSELGLDCLRPMSCY